ncbi:MAG: cell wall hydrolase [Rhodothermales bacterium]
MLRRTLFLCSSFLLLNAFVLPGLSTTDTASAAIHMITPEPVAPSPSLTITRPSLVLNLDRLPHVLPSIVDDETLWLARGIYSETKRAEEQWLVAWVIRNRVETQYRGVANYQDAVLDPYQFSAFNRGSQVRRFYSQLDPDSRSFGWAHALSIAYHVRHLSEAYRPFSAETRHFYSERSMRHRSAPAWADGFDALPIEDIEAERFRFFADVI